MTRVEVVDVPSGEKDAIIRKLMVEADDATRSVGSCRGRRRSRRGSCERQPSSAKVGISSDFRIGRTSLALPGLALALPMMTRVDMTAGSGCCALGNGVPRRGLDP